MGTAALDADGARVQELRQRQASADGITHTPDKNTVTRAIVAHTHTAAALFAPLT